MDCIFWVWITGIFRKNFLSKRKKLQKGFQNVVSWDILPHIFVFLQRHLSRIFFLVKGDNPSTILRLRIASHSQYLLRTIFHLTWKEITEIMLFISMRNVICLIFNGHEVKHKFQPSWSYDFNNFQIFFHEQIRCN